MIFHEGEALPYFFMNLLVLFFSFAEYIIGLNIFRIISVQGQNNA